MFRYILIESSKSKYNLDSKWIKTEKKEKCREMWKAGGAIKWIMKVVNLKISYQFYVMVVLVNIFSVFSFVFFTSLFGWWWESCSIFLPFRAHMSCKRKKNIEREKNKNESRTYRHSTRTKNQLNSPYVSIVEYTFLCSSFFDSTRKKRFFSRLKRNILKIRICWISKCRWWLYKFSFFPLRFCVHKHVNHFRP